MKDDKGKGNMIPLAGLWLQTSKSGTKYMSGRLGGARLMVFKNEKKEPGSKAPDYRVFLVAVEQKPKNSDDAPPPLPADADDIPF